MAFGMEMPSVVAFLHENYPNFIGDDAVEDAADVSEYFSQSGKLCHHCAHLCSTVSIGVVICTTSKALIFVIIPLLSMLSYFDSTLQIESMTPRGHSAG